MHQQFHLKLFRSPFQHTARIEILQHQQKSATSELGEAGVPHKYAPCAGEGGGIQSELGNCDTCSDVQRRRAEAEHSLRPLTGCRPLHQNWASCLQVLFDTLVPIQMLPSYLYTRLINFLQLTLTAEFFYFVLF